MWTGISIAYYSGCLVPLMTGAIANYNTDEHYQFLWSTLPMVLFGVGEIFGGIFTGWVVDQYNSKFSIVINLVVIVIMTGVTIAFIQVN